MPITPIDITTVGQSGAVTLSAQNLPAGLTFTDNGDGTGTITGDLAAGTAGGSPYPVVITATDAGGQEDTEVVTITVEPAPREPFDVGLAAPATPSTAIADYNPFADEQSGALMGPCWTAGPDLIVAAEATSNDNSWKFIDVSDPTSPVVIRTFVPNWGSGPVYGTGGGESARGAADFANRRFMFAGQNGWALYDVSDPVSGVTRVAGGSGNRSGEIGFNGSYYLLHASLGSNTFYLVDADGNEIRQFDANADFDTANESFNFADDKLFLVDGGTGSTLKQVRFSGDAPTLWATYQNGDITTGSGTDSVVRLPGNYVGRVTDSENSPNTSLDIYDLDVAQGSTSVAAVASVLLNRTGSAFSSNKQTYAAAMVASDTDGIVYITLYGNYVVIVDCSDPLNPVLLTEIARGGNIIYGVTVTNGKVVVAQPVEGLSIYT